MSSSQHGSISDIKSYDMLATWLDPRKPWEIDDLYYGTANILIYVVITIIYVSTFPWVIILDVMMLFLISTRINRLVIFYCVFV
jgi:hypothetical protein